MARAVDGAAPGSGRRLRARVRRVVGTPAFAVLVFLISLVVFHWPYLAEEDRWTPAHLFITMFTGWAVVIALVFLLSLFLPSSGSEDKKPPPNG
ncbi:MAG: hypothetical protein K9K65_04535 [Desulfarculaceae bacterium]|nr:hypothetical protein [Desulfarculaceae bacterium]MCF8046260.1 hypothetical protein [Desulfarculaceae bacterium]MCF8063661.1 hypothetical protein [Desulfarculaceae bacterium]MCF8097089.1 hypothetical protein [Desulfarculaceae bacterium]MCF8120957.1 hypothetical protein [Desulfarculaceae bacterium]